MTQFADSLINSSPFVCKVELDQFYHPVIWAPEKLIVSEAETETGRRIIVFSQQLSLKDFEKKKSHFSSSHFLICKITHDYLRLILQIKIRKDCASIWINVVKLYLLIISAFVRITRKTNSEQAFALNLWYLLIGFNENRLSGKFLLYLQRDCVTYLLAL